MSKKKTQRTSKPNLNGIDEIAAHCDDLSHATIMELTFHYGFPIRKNDQSIWEGSSKEIDKWLEKRDLTFRTISKQALFKWEHAQRRKAGTVKKFNRICRNYDDFRKTFGLSVDAVFTFHRDRIGCPIERDPAGGYCVDVDAMWLWMEGQGLAAAPGILTPRETGKGFWYVGG